MSTCVAAIAAPSCYFIGQAKVLGSFAGRKVQRYFGEEANAPKRTINFIKHNWKSIVAIIIAWGVIITLAGVNYGFTAVALKLLIGAGIGAGVGLIPTLLRAIIGKNKKVEKYGSAVNIGIKLLEQMEENTTRRFFLTLLIPVALALAYPYPYLAGGIVMAVMIDYFTHEALFHKFPEYEALTEAIKTLKRKLRKLKGEVASEVIMNEQPILTFAEEKYTKRVQEITDLATTIHNLKNKKSNHTTPMYRIPKQIDLTALFANDIQNDADSISESDTEDAQTPVSEMGQHFNDLLSLVSELEKALLKINPDTDRRILRTLAAKDNNSDSDHETTPML